MEAALDVERVPATSGDGLRQLAPEGGEGVGADGGDAVDLEDAARPVQLDAGPVFSGAVTQRMRC